MKALFKTFLALIALATLAFAGCAAATPNQRVIVTTDIGGTDPDDQESMVHLLLCSNDLDIEGLICQMAFVKMPIGIVPLNKIIDAYAEAYPNLLTHDSGYPSPDRLRGLAVCGQLEVGMSGVGPGMDTDGSELIVNAMLRDDDRPLWLLAWGGTNTIAQALWKLQSTLSDKEMARIIEKVCIYDILGQCDAGAWIVKTFPNILYIRARDVYGWAPEDAWTAANIQAFGPLGNAYPTRRWATEGDSPSFMYLINNGLNMPDTPSAGGWGGRFNVEKSENIKGMDWVERNNLDEMQYAPYYMYTNPTGENTIGRWSQAIRNDFAARVQWSVASEYADANHHPVAIVGKERHPDKSPIIIKARPGKKVTIDASKSTDPDGDALAFNLYLYKEASGINADPVIESLGEGKFSITVPEAPPGTNLHFILEVTDDGTPSLTAYRRIILNVGN